MYQLFSLLPYPFLDFFLALLVFIAAWCAGLWFFARGSGWSTLAKAYRLQGKFAGKRFRGQSASFGHNFHGQAIIRIGANEAGMLIAVFLPFRFAHPTLFVPWSDISTTDMIQFNFAKAPGVTMAIWPDLAKKLYICAGREVPDVN